MARPRKPAIELPPYVNVVRVKGRPYYYCHIGRGTRNARKPIRLPDDPRSPEFWVAYRRAMDEPEPRRSANAIDALIEAYKAAPEWRQLADTTRTNWDLYLKRIAGAWASLRRAVSSQSSARPTRQIRLHSCCGKQSAALSVFDAVVVGAARVAHRQSMSLDPEAQGRRRLRALALGDDRACPRTFAQ